MAETLPAPDRPLNVPAHALWHAGEGAGSWFVLEMAAISADILSVGRYDPHGRLECKSLFIRDAHSSAFDPRVDYAITYPSHCARISILQHGQRFTLIPIPDELVPA